MSVSEGDGVVVVVLTALDVEYEAVRACLVDLGERRQSTGTIFEVGVLPSTRARVALAMTGEGNSGAGIVAERGLAMFKPAVLLFVGIAGALHDDLRLGDVVVATRVYGYHGGREEADGFRARPRSWEAPHDLEQLARHVARTRQRAAPPGREAVHFRPVAAGEVVLNSRTSPLAERISRHYNDAAAIEMESAGAAHAAHLNRAPVMVIRGISDLADGTKAGTDRSGWRKVAAANAAAFALALTAELPAAVPAARSVPADGLRPPPVGMPVRRRVRGAAAILAVALVVAAAPAVWRLTHPSSGRPGAARGQIVVSGVQIARSDRHDGGYRRSYTSGAYAHVVGVAPAELPATGVESLEDAFLAGDGVQSGRQVVLSLRNDLQETAYEALSQIKAPATGGAVVALDPTTGAVLANVSTPTFNPNNLASSDPDAAHAAHQKLRNDPRQPLLNRAVSQAYPPGSIFMVVMAAAALETAGMTAETVIRGGTSYQPAGVTVPVQNAPTVACPSAVTIKQALTVSCNTAFARLGVEHVGSAGIEKTARALGFATVPTFDRDDSNIMAVTPSETGPLSGATGKPDNNAITYASVGLGKVRMTPLQGALIAATIANHGRQMRPYLIAKMANADGTVAYHAQPTVLGEPLTSRTADVLRDMMYDVVENGTASNARVDGIAVAGKTGTAQAGAGLNTHGWFIGFAVKNDRPVAAVAVFLEQAGRGGASEATHIGGAVLKAAAGAP